MAETDQTKNAAKVYLTGDIVAASDARLPLDDRGLLYGFGFFETFRTSGGRPHHWRYNRRRLERACVRANLPLPPSFLANDEARLGEVVRQLLLDRGLADGVFRYTVTAGPANQEKPVEFLTLRPLPPPPPADGICLRVLNLTRDNGEWLPRPKSLNYANAFLGAEEMRGRPAAASDEGLFLSRDENFVVETARQNVFWISGGIVHYPDPSLGVVMGTCLEWLLENGFPVRPMRASLDVFLSADAIAVCNSVRGIIPVREVWDAQDRTRLCSLASASHPLVEEISGRWQETLRATAGESK